MAGDIRVSFPGGLRVDADVGGTVIRTDQPVAQGGDGSAPAPYDLFLASMATCAGIYALGYLRARNLPTEGLALVQSHEVDPTTKTLSRVTLTLRVPEGFPAHHRPAILRAMAGCKVKKAIAAVPQFEVALDESAWTEHAPTAGETTTEGAHV